VEKKPIALPEKQISSGVRKKKKSPSKYPDDDETLELVLRAQRGDAAALNQIIETHLHLAKWYVGKCRGFGLEDPNDVFQNAILSIYRAIRTFKPREDKHGNFFPFFRFAMWSIRSDAHIRRQKLYKKNAYELLSKDGRDNEGIEDESSGRSEAIVLFKMVLERASNVLKPKFWVVFRLYYGRSLTEKQIADELNLSRQVVNWRLRKARVILGEVLEYDGLEIARSWYTRGRPPK
jgi:RNA polymerase sigma factor (sigma-70 family)